MLAVRIAVLVGWLAVPAFSADYKLETVEGLPEGLPAELGQAVDPNGLRVAGADGPLCELWLAREVPEALFVYLGRRIWVAVHATERIGKARTHVPRRILVVAPAAAASTVIASRAGLPSPVITSGTQIASSPASSTSRAAAGTSARPVRSSPTSAMVPRTTPICGCSTSAHSRRRHMSMVKASKINQSSSQVRRRYWARLRLRSRSPRLR
jgi:hypothetical protein